MTIRCVRHDRTKEQMEFDAALRGWAAWPPSECRGRLPRLRRLASRLDLGDRRFATLRHVAKRGEDREKGDREAGGVHRVAGVRSVAAEEDADDGAQTA